jgi:excisionase family DNA binding protein
MGIDRELRDEVMRAQGMLDALELTAGAMRRTLARVHGNLDELVELEARLSSAPTGLPPGAVPYPFPKVADEVPEFSADCGAPQEEPQLLTPQQEWAKDRAAREGKPAVALVQPETHERSVEEAAPEPVGAMPEPLGGLIDVNEAAGILGTSTTYVYQLLKACKIAASRSGRSVRFYRESIEAYKKKPKRGPFGNAVTRRGKPTAAVEDGPAAGAAATEPKQRKKGWTTKDPTREYWTKRERELAGEQAGDAAPPEEILPVSDAAMLLGTTEERVREMIRAGEIQVQGNQQASTKILKSGIDAILAKRKGA